MPARRLAKLNQPMSVGLVRRERLFALLDARSAGTAIWVPGRRVPARRCWSRAGSLPVPGRCSGTGSMLWYRVDADDGDPASFFNDMRAAVRPDEPGRPLRLPDFVRRGPTSAVGFARRFFRNQFAAAEPGLVIVFEDLCILARGCPAPCHYRRRRRTGRGHEPARDQPDRPAAGPGRVARRASPDAGRLGRSAPAARRIGRDGGRPTHSRIGGPRRAPSPRRRLAGRQGWR